MSKQKKVLVVVTSCDRIADTYPTGIWFEEFAIPYVEFKSRGYNITVVSPLSGATPIDPRSLPARESESIWAEALQVLQHTELITSVAAADFDAIFLPGGHGTMFDFPENIPLQKLLTEFSKADKAIAAVCHGPAGLIGVAKSDGKPLIAGKRITGFTNEEERAVQMDKLVPFFLETKLREMGSEFVAQPKFSDRSEQDGKLITGQNPQSSKSVALALISALERV